MVLEARQNGILWRIARLPAGLVFAVLFLTLVFTVYIDEVVLLPEPSLLGTYPILLTAVWLSYPLFVILLASGRFASRSQKRFKLPVAAFFAVQAFLIFPTIVGPATARAFEAGDLAVLVPFWALWLAAAGGLLYLLFAASFALVKAERGRRGGGLQIFGAFLLFGYGPFFGWFFLHRRVWRLVTTFETLDPVAIELPMEKLTLDKDASGHLALVLTERVGWDDFEAYASEVLRRLDARVSEKASTVDMHLWEAQVESVPLRLVYEDFLNRVSLESDSYPGDMLLKTLQTRLRPVS
ncbi:DUF3630 family protein [Pelagibius sp.]|uniref:DUF3630 family protein n=1 Tax=Pelagibius sp. TaxID=1931238 RepID=UPI00262890FB|nr:DUF3630 family protein [Pelagibius sp.]